MRWNGGKKGGDPVAFIARASVFDPPAGSRSSRPAACEDMKGDMAGRRLRGRAPASVAERKARVNAVGAIGLSRTWPDGKAQRPETSSPRCRDRRSRSSIPTPRQAGAADVLHYVNTRFKPKFMIDLRH